MFGGLFGKKKDEFSLDDSMADKDNPFFSDPAQSSQPQPRPDANPFASPAPQQPSSNPFSPSAFGERSAFEQGSADRKDLELISSKLDTIKAMLENVMQRLDHLEKDKALEKPIQPKKWY